MCTGKCSRCIACALYPLVFMSMLCNIILFFPEGSVKYSKEGHLTDEVKYLGGLIGGGLMVSFLFFFSFFFRTFTESCDSISEVQCAWRTLDCYCFCMFWAVQGVDPSTLHQLDRRRWMLWKPLWGESVRQFMHPVRDKGLFRQSVIFKIRKSWFHTQLNINVLWKPVVLIKKKEKRRRNMPLGAASPLHNTLVYLR